MRAADWSARAAGWSARAAGWSERAAGWSARAAGWSARAAGWSERAAGWSVRAADCSLERNQSCYDAMEAVAMTTLGWLRVKYSPHEPEDTRDNMTNVSGIRFTSRHFS